MKFLAKFAIMISPLVVIPKNLLKHPRKLIYYVIWSIGILMSCYKKLKDNPIKEVVFGVSLKQLFREQEELETIKNGLRDKFPRFRPATETSVAIKANENKEPFVTQKVLGLHLVSEDVKQLLVLEQQLFQTRSKRGYVNFEKSLEDFTSYFNLAHEHAPSMDLGEKVILEYVNRFDFNYDELARFFCALPNISLPKDEFSLNQFTGIYKTETRTGIRANVIADMLPVQGKIRVMFAISVSKYHKGLKPQDFKVDFTELHQTACDIFFKNLTDEYKKVNSHEA